MATIVTVHGTFAHEQSDSSSGGPGPGERQWWQEGSAFEQDMRDLLAAAPGVGSGRLEVTRFEWSGDNSELVRREAGRKLLAELESLEAAGEPYCVVGHSHGGSVMGWAMLESAARARPLGGLKRWITVGTPFVSLRKEPLLFQRLDLLRKVVFVASLMLMMMFIVYILAESISSGRMLFGSTFPGVLAVTGTMMSLPILFFYVVLRYLDGRSLLHHRASVRERARKLFGPRWLSLTHTDDEAVQGLAFLPGAKLYFFDKAFAVQAITMLSVVALPLLYLLVLTSPGAMVGLGGWLKQNVYDISAHAGAEKALREAASRLRESRASGPRDEAARRAVWQDYRQARQQLEARYPKLREAERGLRFRQRFFEKDGQPCEGGQLCGGGRDLRINSGLLLHLVTDELSWAIGGEGLDGRENWLLRLLIPAVLVPVIFGLVALLLMLAIRTLARLLSHATSVALNRITNDEVKRAAFGNDTEGEIALGAVDRPGWVERSPPRLPESLGELVTAYSNGIASQSLAKFRRAIGQLASVEPKHTADSAITTYFTWKELVHASYFDVPEFRKLVAQAIARADGFAPTVRFKVDPDYPRTAQWLAQIEGVGGSMSTPAAMSPTTEDKGAVAAVVASTVKQQP
ncbi:MAG: hypothetical protein AB7O57_04960 [Hyphomicrobiaceae bacterium]